MTDRGAFWCGAIRSVATYDFCGKKCPVINCTDSAPWKRKERKRSEEVIGLTMTNFLDAIPWVGGKE